MATDSSKSLGSETAYSLQQPLPSDVVVRSSGRLGSYRNYPVFSAPWFWKRTQFFGPAAAVIGLLQSMTVWKVVDWRTSALFTIGVVLIWVFIVVTGPALATIVRHRHMPARRERVALVVAVAVGVALSFAAQYLADRLTRDFLLPRAYAAGTLPKPPRMPPNVLGIAVILTWQGVVFFVLGGGVALRTYFNEREMDNLRRQKSDADMKLTVLQAQVEPHFLFNTLASIHSLVRQDPRRAEATIEALVDHLRATLPKLRAGVGTTRSTLEEQLDVCTSYLAVMQVRMGERLRYDVDVPPELRAHPFPPLMLISLVENAIKHGIEPSASGGGITIRARESGEARDRHLQVSVIDEGVGLRPGLGDGTGLANVRAQLAEQFGAHGRLTIQSRAEGGVVATLIVPTPGSRS
jgi:two-component sensor histidine kinase